MTNKRAVFFLSDGTGITAEALGRSLLTQFDSVAFDYTNWPFIDTVEKAQEAARRIEARGEQSGQRPLVFSTLIHPELREALGECNALVFDFFATFTGAIERELGTAASHVAGRSHGMGNYARYNARMDSLNFALANDDGATTNNYPVAELILTGVSRTGKTPTCLYLGLQYGILAANYPITEDDIEAMRLPEPLRPFKERLFGLTINPERLQRIRSERLPNSRYADIEQCSFEIRAVEALFRREGIPFMNTSQMSVEEIASTLIHRSGLQRRF